MDRPLPMATKGRGAASNPPSRFLVQRGTWREPDPDWKDEDDPAPATRFTSDASRSVISWNDSPDLPFRASVNPYRGCEHGCNYCLVGETPILMADGTTRHLQDVRVGDRIVGTERAGWYRRYVETEVLAHWATRKMAYLIRLEDGTELVASGDHRFLTERGWKHVTGTEQGRMRRPHLTTGNKLMGTGRFTTPLPQGPAYRRGYLCGMVRGDGLLRSYRYDRPGRSHGDQHHFRLALIDDEGLDRTSDYLNQFGIETRRFAFNAGPRARQPMNAVGTSSKPKVEAIRHLIDWPEDVDLAWCAGFVAGIFDAEGSSSGGIVRIANTDFELIDMSLRCLRRLGFAATVDGQARDLMHVRVLGGLKEHLRLFHLVRPAITRKRAIIGQRLKSAARLRVEAIEPLGDLLPMFDITTGTGDFIANGVVSHNCYARPTHEYYGLSAGMDFETRIVVKEDAPRLLREELSKKSWEPQPIAFSGVTDCYQPVERRLRLTRACLEVLLELRNPVIIITKSALITRDVDLLSELAKLDLVSVTLSVTSLDPELSGALEPRAARPRRRLEAVRALADAGVPVGVNVAPVIPGLNDRELPAILAAAKDHGAQRAGMVFLRLPHGVKELFDEWLANHRPGERGKVLDRLRALRGGKLYDPAFHARMSGAGPYAAQVEQLFDVTCARLGLNGERRPLSTAHFRVPVPEGGQLGLFGEP